MGKAYVLAGALMALAFASAAVAQWNDDFDSYTGQAEFQAVWIPLQTSLALSQDVSVSPPNAAYQEVMQAQSCRRAVGTNIPASQLYFGFWFYDPSPQMARTYSSVYARESGNWEGSVAQILSIGKYTSITTSKYSARVAFGGINWFTLDSGPDRSVGWHLAEIVGNGDGTVDFRIDGIIGATQPVAEVGFSWVVMGSGLTSAYPMYYDDASIRYVPEPAGLLAVGAGLALFVRRRRFSAR